MTRSALIVDNSPQVRFLFAGLIDPAEVLVDVRLNSRSKRKDVLEESREPAAPNLAIHKITLHQNREEELGVDLQN